MRFNYIAVAALLVLFSFSLLFNVSSAQLGEVAGEPTFYVNISGTYHYNYTFINEGSTPIPFKTIMTSFRTSAKNSTPPVVTADPSYGTIPPNSQIHIEVSVYLPSKNNTSGMQWQGVFEVVDNSTSNKVGGAVINEGVAKIITVVAKPPKPNYTVYILSAIIAIAIVAAAGSAVYFKGRGKARARVIREAEVAKSRAAGSKKGKATQRSASKSKSKRSTGKKKPTRKKSTGKKNVRKRR
ncbi:hypothetical protein Micr_00921 [Candidatus Micrarchaeum sp.]|uniref:hypothetical protein n=1 Tax=Candidatus Micrarchaeum sp. TaxID=2282148 RepID=UPI0019329930|nr:hypothetical protein [Candidatus Micrarchaeum sp.]QRF74385.1 hypothetical protein Micr_00921 [Candidatus Micrarchaeum sp.]